MNNMENFERDDAFFGMVNKNNEVANSVEQTRLDVARNVNSYYTNIARAKAAIARENEQKKQIEKAKKIKVMAISAALIALLGSGITTSIVHAEEINTAIEDRRDYEEAVNMLSRHYRLVFEARRLSSGISLNDNSISKYKDLNITTIEDVYVILFESSFDMSDNYEQEMDKFIKSVSYYDENGQIKFYTSYEEFLKLNGFANEKEFKKAARDSIISKYKAGDIRPYYYDGTNIPNVAVEGKGR